MENPKIEKLSCKFIGDFPTGDNMVLNADALVRMHGNNTDGLFNKLMVVQAGSLVEASLDQIFYRAKNFTKEGLPNIPEEERKEISSKKVERFATMIAVMQKHKMLDGLGADIYKELERLRQFRNRVHIHLVDEPEGAGQRENHAFSKVNVEWAFKLSIRVLKYLSDTYPRPETLEQFAHEIPMPNAL